MNYPFRTAILAFLRQEEDGGELRETVMTIAENYPPQVLHCNMNLLGSHDTARILTALVDDFDGSRAEQAARKLSPAQRQLAKERLVLASVLQYMLPGAPSLYYADEAGMEGYKDPFNRRTYPWGREDTELLGHFRQLGQLRMAESALRLGTVEFFQAGDGRIGFCRSYEQEQIKIYVNRSEKPWEIPVGTVLLERNVQTAAPQWLSVGPMGFCVVKEG